MFPNRNGNRVVQDKQHAEQPNSSCVSRCRTRHMVVSSWQFGRASASIRTLAAAATWGAMGFHQGASLGQELWVPQHRVPTVLSSSSYMQRGDARVLLLRHRSYYASSQKQ